jgi:hypothetical protein
MLFLTYLTQKTHIKRFLFFRVTPVSKAFELNSLVKYNDSAKQGGIESCYFQTMIH